ncbi:hypothetical protein AGMMS50212_12840 [Spirochaetia bacterium]|nr:hypothetical protein AGMMS50212_12840 [Spirochaetia bacterium]
MKNNYRVMRIFIAISCLVLSNALWAQDEPAEPVPTGTRRLPRQITPDRGFNGNRISLHLITRVLDEGKKEVWNSDSEKLTIPGRPVGLTIVGDNVIVVVQFTPYPRRNGKGTLVAQGQIWVDDPKTGVQYKTTMQTVPLDYGERIFFFPLGSDESSDSPHIEIQLEMSRYKASDPK